MSGGRRAAAGVFVTGSDTGVGKTLVACSLVRELRSRGLDVAAMKPIETGVGPEGPLDAQALCAAADAVEPLERVCPFRFTLPAAPSVAARHEGRQGTLEPATLRAAFDAVAKRHAHVVVEGAGGWRVPIAPGFDMADLAESLALPVLLVARASLGTINHTLLSRDAIAQRGLQLAGVVVSHGPASLSPADAENLAELRSALGEDLLGEIPSLGAGAGPAALPGRVAALADRLIRTLALAAA